MSKKRIILILLLVVAAFIAWRKGLFAKLTGKTGGGSTPGAPEAEPVINSSSDPDKFNQELKSFMARMNNLAGKLGLTPNEKENFLTLVRNIYVWCHDDNEDHWSAAVMATTARNNGFTLDQQYALSALWAMCPEGWSEEVITKPRYLDLVKIIKS